MRPIRKLLLWLKYSFRRQKVQRWKIEKKDRCTIYTGALVAHTAKGRVLCQVPARIVEWPGLPVGIYVCRLPSEIKRHPHGSCFQLVDAGQSCFKLHWERAPRDSDAARAYVEEMLSAALGR